jgi:hypothetical protein
LIPSQAPGDAPGASADTPTKLGPGPLVPLLGLGGPGGYLVLVGPPAAGWRELGARLPGIGLIAVNPPGDVVDEAGISVLRGARLALKSRSMRGVALGVPFGDDPHWVGEAARVVLPGLRVVGEGADPAVEHVELLASAGGVWVATPRR